jgi:hypothetical protein
MYSVTSGTGEDGGDGTRADHDGKKILVVVASVKNEFICGKEKREKDYFKAIEELE